MANQQLASRTSLNSYLKKYIDDTKDWENENITDYSVLNDAYAKGKISNDVMAEGKTYLQQYLADVDATNKYNAANTQADNTARQQTAYQRYLNSRLGSYLGEIQGNAGVKGYNGVVEGQAVALHNAELDNQRQIAQEQANTKASALSDYMSAKQESSKAALDSLTEIDAAREAKMQEDFASAKENIANMVDLDEKISADKNTQVNTYIESLKLNNDYKQQLKDYYKMTYGDKIEQAQAASSQTTSQVPNEPLVIPSGFDTTAKMSIGNLSSDIVYNNISSPVGKGKGGKQDKLVAKLVEDLKAGKVQNGQYITFNYGLGDNKKDFYYYFNGNLYPVSSSSTNYFASARNNMYVPDGYEWKPEYDGLTLK